jgi:hypothetical protein
LSEEEYKRNKNILTSRTVNVGKEKEEDNGIILLERKETTKEGKEKEININKNNSNDINHTINNQPNFSVGR